MTITIRLGLVYLQHCPTTPNDALTNNALIAGKLG
jgi:hypothetical protein